MNLNDYFVKNLELGEELMYAIKRFNIALTTQKENDCPNRGIADRDIVALFYSDSPLLSQDNEGRLNFYNLGAQRVFGYAPQEAIGMKSVELVPLPLRTARADKFKHILEERTSVEVQEARLAKGDKLIKINAIVFPYLLDSKLSIAARVDLLDANGNAIAPLRK